MTLRIADECPIRMEAFIITQRGTKLVCHWAGGETISREIDGITSPEEQAEDWLAEITGYAN